jgi:hypothetical protein
MRYQKMIVMQGKQLSSVNIVSDFQQLGVK